jgi:uncharacterized protein YheU (UPF0270 family)
LSKSDEVIRVPDDESPHERLPEFLEEGVDVPVEQINPDTLRNLISEFVTREWEEFCFSPDTLEDKIEQVMDQLKSKKAKVVFDLKTETCNIILGENLKRRR